MFKIRSIEHIAIAVKDTDAEAQWYCETLGFTIASKSPSTPRGYFIKDPEGDCMIELIPAPELDKVDHFKTNPMHLHIAFEVDDFDAAYDALLQKGVKFEGERPTGTGQRLVIFRDPEGVPLQIVYRPNPLK